MPPAAEISRATWVNLGESAPGKEDLRSLTCESTGYRAADRTTASVDHSVLVLKQHSNLLVSIKWSRIRNVA